MMAILNSLTRAHSLQQLQGLLHQLSRNIHHTNRVIGMDMTRGTMTGFKEWDSATSMNAMANHTSVRMGIMSDTGKDSWMPGRMKMHLELMNGKDI